ncbi:hypothetical protein P3L10_020972 [Capsicum annuum]
MGKYGPYWRNMRKETRTSNSGEFPQESGFELRCVDLSTTLASLGANMACLMVIGSKYNYMEEGFGDDEKCFKDMGLVRHMKQVANSTDEFLENVIDKHVRQYSNDQPKQTSTDMDCWELCNLEKLNSSLIVGMSKLFCWTC